MMEYGRFVDVTRAFEYGRVVILENAAGDRITLIPTDDAMQGLRVSGLDASLKQSVIDAEAAYTIAQEG